MVEALVADGAQILVQPSFNRHVWDAWQEEDWKRGLWTAAEGVTTSAVLVPLAIAVSPADGQERETETSMVRPRNQSGA